MEVGRCVIVSICFVVVSLDSCAKIGFYIIFPTNVINVNDTVLVDESRDGVNAKLEKWRGALKSKGFKPNKDGIYEL